MAGGKETPRQKLINLMYLVLLALLALQVSSSVLDKFWTLNVSLEGAKNDTEQANIQKIKSISKAVEDAGRRANDVAVLEKAKKIRKLTDKALSELEAMKIRLVEITGGTENNVPVGMKDEDKVAEYMILNKNGLKLKTILNTYNTQLIKLVDYKSFTPHAIAIEPKNDPRILDKKQKKKNFSVYNFANTPLIAALPTLSQFETEIINREADALKSLADQVGAEDLAFDQIKLIANAESRVVAAGTKYKADLIVAASSSALTPAMTVDGRKISVDGSSKFGQVEFTASAGKYDKEGRAQKSYKAKVVLDQGGVRKVIEEVIPYTVVKPVMQIQSASVNALYLNCGNEIVVNVPALGTAYNPSFSGSGARFVPGAKKGMVTIVPNGKKVLLNVSSSGNRIGSQKFGVRKVPKPDIVPMNRGTKRPIDQKRGFSKSLPTSLIVKAEADESFKQFLPKDARYKVLEMDVTLARNNRPKPGGRLKIRKKTNQVRTSGTLVNLGKLRQLSKTGDLLLIEVKKVVRVNYKNEVEEVNLPQSFFTFPVN